MVELQLPKLTARVRFPSPARDGNPRSQTWGFVIPGGSGPAGRSRGRRRRTTYDGDGSGRARRRRLRHCDPPPLFWSACRAPPLVGLVLRAGVVEGRPRVAQLTGSRDHCPKALPRCNNAACPRSSEEIGRASCRERVELAAGAVRLNKTQREAETCEDMVCGRPA